MKAFGYVLSLIVLGAACGQVKEKEVKLEMLPEGETNASYASTKSDDEDETSTEETETDTATKEQLAAVNQEMWSKKGETCANTPPRVCSLAAEVSITDAIVTAVRSCASAGNGCRVTPDTTAATSGPQFAFVQKLDGTASLLHVRGSNGGIATDLSIGSKISFKAKAFNQTFGMMRIFTVDSASVTVSTATGAEMFQLNDTVADIGSIDFSKAVDTDHLYKLTSGYVKVNEQTNAMSGDNSGAYWSTLNTKTYPEGSKLYFRINSTALVKNKCYLLKNVFLTTSTTPSSSGVYVIDQGAYNTKTYGPSSYTEVDCTVAGL
jgi:hypothetical protein